MYRRHHMPHLACLLLLLTHIRHQRRIGAHILRHHRRHILVLLLTHPCKFALSLGFIWDRWGRRWVGMWVCGNAGMSVCRCLGVWYVGMWECGYVRMSICRYVGVRLCGYVGMWVCGYVGMWVCRYVGMWVCGYVGMWVCGYVGVVCYLLALTVESRSLKRCSCCLRCVRAFLGNSSLLCGEGRSGAAARTCVCTCPCPCVHVKCTGLVPGNGHAQCT